jgi:hypothetical protein
VRYRDKKKGILWNGPDSLLDELKVAAAFDADCAALIAGIMAGFADPTIKGHSASISF